MPLLVDEQRARERLIYLTQAASEPQLEDDEIDDLLADASTVSVWSAATNFEHGDRVIPTTANRNGHIYRVARFDGSGRSTGSTEPSWPDYYCARVTDGDITWEEAGRAPSSLWDLSTAAHRGWLLKAGKAAQQFDYGDMDHKQSASQLHKHCLEMAEKFNVAEVL